LLYWLVYEVPGLTWLYMPANGEGASAAFSPYRVHLKRNRKPNLPFLFMEAAFFVLSHCVRAIDAELNERGILTPRGGAWHPTSAARLLSRLQV